MKQARILLLYMSCLSSSSLVLSAPPSEEWITILVHGIIGFGANFCPRTLFLAKHDEIEGSKYEQQVSSMRTHRYLSTVQPTGSLGLDSVYSKKARELAHRLADAGIPVLTGGGPGIMEAANCGAIEVNKGVITTLGITVTGLVLNDQPKSCNVDVIVMNNYVARKWLLIHYAVGFAVFPGGFGTLDELMELLTLVQTKFRIKVPIVLIGTEYWKPFVEWITQSALKEKLIDPEDAKLFVLTDDIDEAFTILITVANQTKSP